MMDRFLNMDEVTREFVEVHAEDTSNIIASGRQKLWYGSLVLLFVGGLIYRWDVTLCVVNFLFAFLYLCIILFRTIVVIKSLMGDGGAVVSDQQLDELKNSDLPIFTILVPLYHESNVAEKIVHYLGCLDYPKDKLDVKLLLEEDDDLTISAVRGMTLPSCYDVIIVPDFQPKTKPKACNYGLKRAKGEFCVIFDAEDRPDSDQLKKVLCVFRKAKENVACVQAKLNFYNPTQNVLTRFFSIEYSTTFDLFLPGLQGMRVPMPLGGTSNHFRTEALQKIGGWDPFNVTEDCDLGVRLYKMGFLTEMVDSTTWEEANPNLWNWIRQRSRWVKGFFQTYLTHMRHPLRTFRHLGLWGFSAFVISVGASSLMMVLNVIIWIMGGTYFYLVCKAMNRGYGLWEVLKGPRDWLAGSAVWPMIYYGPKQDVVWSALSIGFFVVAGILLAANLLFVLIHCIACFKRKFYNLLPFALLMPFYWVLISIGAWKGFIQLFTNPFYWEKTHHGLSIDDEQVSGKSPMCVYLAHLTVEANFRDDVVERLEALGSAFVEWDEVDSDHVVFDEYFESSDEALSRVAELKSVLPAAMLCSLEFRTLEKEDWAESWKKHFKAERISEHIVVRPSWESFDAKPDDCVVVLDPGMSFGTGQHPTTRNCLRFIDRLSGEYPASSFLDIGCGSGILSIAGVGLGLTGVTAIDVDDVAVDIAVQNCATNGVSHLVDCLRADMSIFSTDKTFDIVVANMLAHLLAAMVPQIAAVVSRNKNARLIVSGCLDSQIDDVLVAFLAEGFKEESRISDDGWTSACLFPVQTSF